MSVIFTKYISNENKIECNCVDFRKNYKCKHSLGIALLQKKVDCPPEAKNAPIGERRKRGRPKKNSEALKKD